MSEFVKPAGGAMIGTSIPIIIEFGAQGKRVSEGFPFKWSGVMGTGLGTIEMVIAYMGHKGIVMDEWRDKSNVALVAAMGGAKFATGVSILVLDELRKRAAYAFRKGRRGELPIGPEGLEREPFPTEPMVEEI